MDKHQIIREALAHCPAVQAGLAFGVPADARDQWLDLVTEAIEAVIK